MSLNSNSSVVTNGLVFNYDASNNKSYRSPPIRNILNQITPRGLSVSTLYNFSSGTENVYIPALGWINNCQYVDMYNDYNGGSNNCCPSPYGYGDGLVVSPSTLYTYAMVYKSTNGYTHPNYMYHYEFTSAGSYLTEYGVFGNNGSTAKIRSLGNDWYWASATFTSNASAGLMNTGSWMYEYGRFNRFHVAKVMLVPGNYIDMHPSLWPELNTTVSNTQAILDLTVINTITANSLTYASDGTFSFNGSTDKLTLNTNTLLSGVQNYTIDAVFRISVAGSVDYIFGNYGVSSGANAGLEYYIFQNRLNNFISGNSQSLTNLNANQWYISSVVRSGTTITHYLNGQPDGSSSLGSSIATVNPFTIGNGHDYTSEAFGGTIAAVKVYNRALTAAEVRQNFNSQRGRYGI